VGECFFWYQPTWVVPDKGPLNGCVFFLKVFVIEHFYLVISIDKIAFFLMSCVVVHFDLEVLQSKIDSTTVTVCIDGITLIRKLK